MLLDISQEMSTIASLDDALATLLSITTREMGVDRCSLFLNDTRSDELYSRVAENIHDEIRFPNNAGIAGHVFTSGDGIIVLDAYADKRFNTDVDKATGYKTDSILCAPVKTPTGEIIGVAQALNKLDGSFGQDDMELLEAMTRRASNVLLSTQAQDMAVPGFMRKLQSSVKDCFAAILPRSSKKPVPEASTDVATEMATVAGQGTETEQISAELSKEPAFQGCASDSLARFLAHVSMREIKRGELVHQIDAQANDTYLIVNGEFEIVSNGGKPITVVSGFLGEEAGIGLDSYVSECKATQRSPILVMPAHAIKSLAATGPLRDRLIASFSGRFRCARLWRKNGLFGSSGIAKTSHWLGVGARSPDPRLYVFAGYAGLSGNTSAVSPLRYFRHRGHVDFQSIARIRPGPIRRIGVYPLRGSAA